MINYCYTVLDLIYYYIIMLAFMLINELDFKITFALSQTDLAYGSNDVVKRNAFLNFFHEKYLLKIEIGGFVNLIQLFCVVGWERFL